MVLAIQASMRIHGRMSQWLSLNRMVNGYPLKIRRSTSYLPSVYCISLQFASDIALYLPFRRRRVLCGADIRPDWLLQRRGIARLPRHSICLTWKIADSSEFGLYCDTSGAWPGLRCDGYLGNVAGKIDTSLFYIMEIWACWKCNCVGYCSQSNIAGMQSSQVERR